MMLPRFKRRGDNPYRPTSRRQRLVIIAVTLTTVLVLWALLLYRPGGHPRVIPAAAPDRCAPGQTSGCVGGKADVIVIPVRPASGGGAR